MTKKEIILKIEEDKNNYIPEYLMIDEAIKPLVDFINENGFYPYASCSSHIFNYNNQPIMNQL